MKRLALLLSALAALSLSACKGDGGAEATPSPSKPSAAPAAKKSPIPEGAVVIDVRTPQETAGGFLDGAHLIPVQEIGGRIAEVEALVGGDKSKPIAVYCRSGGRSATAKQILEQAGFTNVTNAGAYTDLK